MAAPLSVTGIGTSSNTNTTTTESGSLTGPPYFLPGSTFSGTETHSDLGPLTGLPVCQLGGSTPFTGSLTLTAANGDTLVTSLSGTVCASWLSGIPIGIVYTGTYTITGGTGQFRGASGSGTMAGSSASGTFEPAGTFHLQLDGTIDFPHPTSTSVSCTPNPVPVGSPTTCKATVTDKSTGTKTTPTGTVSFMHTNTGAFAPAPTCVLGPTTPPTTGVATCSVTYTPLMAGAHQITASYEGDSAHDRSSGSTTLNTKATACPPGDTDDRESGDDDRGDERAHSSTNSSPIRPTSGSVLDVLLRSVKSDECDNDRNDRGSDHDRRGSDGD